MSSHDCYACDTRTVKFEKPPLLINNTTKDLFIHALSFLGKIESRLIHNNIRKINCDHLNFAKPVVILDNSKGFMGISK
jgi:hypothetical protein